ncbi:MAG: phosphatidylserine decarboxylase [Chromatiaceae bacterium]|nr:phosphatidylserine decarboxylase [Chromatiaceae bacterium]
MTQASLDLRARLFVALQQLIPQHALSHLMHRVAKSRHPLLKTLLIRAFARLYRIEMREALEPDLGAYPHFNAFFTRALRPEARPLDPDSRAILCPVDGAISQIGAIEAGTLIQAKGQRYRLVDLLGGDTQHASALDGGRFATLYLSPRDYHRIHLPLAARPRAMTHVPGRLFSVNATTTALVPGLFARNERLVAQLDTDAGPMTLVLVGAIFVGGIETVWDGVITPPHRPGAARHWTLGKDARPLGRGAELGRFNLGSTVILLFPPGMMEWHATLAPGQPVRLGQALGLLRENTSTSGV